MNLIFLYGPPAAGKLTVAQELATLLNYKLFHNHAILNVLADVFPFGDQKLSPIRKKLGWKFRLEVFEEAAQADVDLITTFGRAGGQYFDFFSDVIRAVEGNNGRVLFIQVTATEEVLLQRVANQSRKDHKKISSPEHLQEMLHEGPNMFEKYPDREHLSIDTRILSPRENAERIIEYYGLG